MIKGNSNCIKMGRLNKNLSILQLADKLHIEASVIRGIELGVKFPTLDILIKMCAIFELSSDALLFNETREPLTLNGLSFEQKETVRYLYKKLRELDEGYTNGYSR